MENVEAEKSRAKPIPQDINKTLARTGYQVQVSEEISDSNWDEFLAKTPGGHHVQTSLWAQVKATLKWKTVRIIVTKKDRIVAGAQLLLRSIMPFITVAYLTKGPVIGGEGISIAEAIIQYVIRISQEKHVLMLVIQPPNDGKEIASLLATLGFQPSSLELAPTASVILDLSPTEDQILKGMKRRTRNNIHRSEQAGIKVREGKESDLEIFYQLHIATSQRQKFFSYSKEYYRHMWHVFEPHEYIGLLVAEHDNKPISALLLIPFGNTVIAKIIGWSGEHSDLRPNDAIFWNAIKWSKMHGYLFFDFEGIDSQGAKAVLAGESLPARLHHSPDFFKLGYGGNVVLYPQAFEIVRSSLLNWIYQKTSPTVGGHSIVSRTMDWIRKL